MRPMVSFGSGSCFACCVPQPASASIETMETIIKKNSKPFFKKRTSFVYWNNSLPSICTPVRAYDTTVSIVSRFSS